MYIGNEMIPLHIAVQIEQQKTKVEPVYKSKKIDKNILQDLINRNNTQTNSDCCITETDRDILLAILQNPNINPRDVNANILLAKEYNSYEK